MSPAEIITNIQELANGSWNGTRGFAVTGGFRFPFASVATQLLPGHQVTEADGPGAEFITVLPLSC